MFLGCGAFRLDCFAFISKSAIPFEEWSEARKGETYAANQDEPNNACFPLGVIRILDKTLPLLIVLEHASGSWLASAQDSYHRSTGFSSSNNIFA